MAVTIGRSVLTVAFLVHALTHDRPMINLRFTACDNLPLIALCISFFRLVVMSASCIIPQSLITALSCPGMPDIGSA